MDRLGAEFWFNISNFDMSPLGMTVFSENLDAALRRLKVMMRDLTFSKELLNRERARIIDDFEDYIDDNARQQSFFAITCTNTIRTGARGTRTALENLTARDLQHFWDQTLRAKVLFFYVISDLSKSEIDRSLRVMTYNRVRDGFPTTSPAKT